MSYSACGIEMTLPYTLFSWSLYIIQKLLKNHMYTFDQDMIGKSDPYAKVYLLDDSNKVHIANWLY